MSKAVPAVRTGSAQGSPFFDKCHRYEEADRIKKAGVYSFFRVVGSAQDPEVTIDGRRLIMLGSNNYLGLTNDPRVTEAAIEAIRKYGSGCAGSRFLNGTLMMVWPDPIWAPRATAFLASCLLLCAVYRLVRLLFEPWPVQHRNAPSRVLASALEPA